MKLTTALAILMMSFSNAKDLNVAEWNHVLAFGEACVEKKADDIPSLLKATILKTDASADLIAKLVDIAIIQYVHDQDYINTIFRWAVATAPDAYDEIAAVVDTYAWEEKDEFLRESFGKGAKVVFEKRPPNPLDYIKLIPPTPFYIDTPVTQVGNRYPKWAIPPTNE